MEESRIVGKRFGRAALVYDAVSLVQAKARLQLMSLIPESPQPNSILELGCGTGALSSELSTKFNRAKVSALDISKEMIAVAREKHRGREIEWIVEDVFSYSPHTPFDLVVSNASLQWFSPYEHFAEKLKSALSKDSLFVCSFMTEQTLIELRNLRRELFPHNAPMRELPGLSEVSSTFQNAGFSVVHSSEEVFLTSHENAKCFFLSLHDMGVNSGSLSKGVRPLRRNELKLLMDEYQSRYSNKESAVPATYSVGYLAVKKEG